MMSQRLFIPFLRQRSTKTGSQKMKRSDDMNPNPGPEFALLCFGFAKSERAVGGKGKIYYNTDAKNGKNLLNLSNS